MIQIKISENKMKRIEQKHWEWFRKYYEKNIIINKVGTIEKFYYKIYDKKAKKYNEKEVDDIEVERLLRYIT
ncbi:MAG: hypothetical protein E6274_14710, partial [Clostridium sp.]|uniref:hypothetical protein n=1 Tax=Clostridium sp. TaxID=1506 RepID=UPI00290981BC